MSNLALVNNIKDLVHLIEQYDPEYIVLEGYNSVGKGMITEKLLNILNLRVYRPEYNGWCNLIPKDLRWTIFASFMDVVSTTNTRTSSRILLDRGFFTGVVYNNIDPYLYKSIVKEKKVLNILVECSEEDYNKFLNVRKSEKPLYYKDYLEYTSLYKRAMHLAGADYIEYYNIFSDSLNYEDICAGCSHYTSHDNTCHNPVAIENGITNVSHNRKRCEYSSVKEVQDARVLQLL